MQETEKQRKKILNRFLINNLLLVVVIVMIFSGLAMQLGFHVGGPDGHRDGRHNIHSEALQYEQIREIDTSKIVCGLAYPDWSTTHKFAIVFFSLLMIYHIYTHWKWYKRVITKHLIGKNFQVITLTVLFLLVAVNGLVPWFINLSGSTSILRLIFIEIHDKLTFILIIYLCLHVIQRTNWFSTAYVKLKR
jgi:hypothetical protein